MVGKLSTYAGIFSACFLFLLGCGEEETDVVKESNQNQNQISSEAPLGLSGETYRNQRFLFKVSNLPMEGWSIFTVETEVGREFLTGFYGEKEEGEHDSHRLLSTVPFIVDNFAEYSEKKDKANRQGEISILVEVISKAEVKLIRSAEDLAQVYKLQKAALGLPMKSEKQVVSADGYSGYAIYGDISEDGEQAEYGYAFFTRPSGKSQRIYRLAYVEVYRVGETSKYKGIFEQMVASLEFNIL